MAETKANQVELTKELLGKIKDYLKADIVGYITEEGGNAFVFHIPGGKKIRIQAEEIK